MKNRKPFTSILNGHRGATAVVVAILLVVLVGIISLAIDIGYLYATRNELQNTADAAALAGAGKLGAIYLPMELTDQSNYVCNDGDQQTIFSAAKDVALKNQAATVNIVLNDSDIVIGTWDGQTHVFTPTLSQPDAVRVTSRRDSSANGPVMTFFARVFNIDTADVSAVATAALTGPAKVDEGELKLPIGLSMNQFPNNCTDLIQFSPTTDSCAGWHNFFDKINASALSDKLIGFILSHPDGPQWLADNFEMLKYPDPAITPETDASDYYQFQGGTVSSLFLGDEKNPPPFPTLFDFFKTRDGDGNDEIWTTTVPVYADGDSCENPNTALQILGFATVEVIMPNPPPDSTVQVKVYCDLSVVEGRGGGSNYGEIKGSIPNLVE